MKQYGDEAFIYKLANKDTAPKFDGNDIRNGSADVGETAVPFCERCIIEGRLYMTIPAEFEPLPSKVIKRAYPYEGRPDIVFAADEKASKSVSFRTVNTPPESTETADVLEYVLNKTNPAHEVINTILVCASFELVKAKEKEKLSVCYFELVTDDDGKEMSGLTFFFPLDGQFVIGSFNCLSVDLPEWMEVAEQMLHTIRII